MLQINGSPTDAAAGLIKNGIHAGARRQRLQDARRVRHARLGAAQGAAMGERPDHPLRQEDRRRRRGQRRHRRRRHRRLQGGRRRSGAAGDRQRRHDRGAAADHRGRPVQHDLQALARSSAAAAAEVAVQLLNGETPEADDDALRHAVAALRAGGGHAPRTSRPRSSTRASRTAAERLHRPLRRGLQEARHHSDRGQPTRARPPFGGGRAHPSPDEERAAMTDTRPWPPTRGRAGAQPARHLQEFRRRLGADRHRPRRPCRRGRGAGRRQRRRQVDAGQGAGRRAPADLRHHHASRASR